MSAYERLFSLYRRSIKRAPGIHRAGYWIAEKLLAHVVEPLLSFRTCPDDPLWLRLDLLSGAYESETGEIIRRSIRPGMVVLDVGAHVGYYSRLFARLVGDTGRVVAFEPHPMTYDLLIRNVGSLANVFALNVAASDSEARAVLHDGLPESAGASLMFDASKYEYYAQMMLSENTPRARGGMPVREYHTKTVRIDAALRDIGVDAIDFVKMDIEGAELAALRGMEGAINRAQRLLMVVEFNPRALASFGVDPTALVDYLYKLGFESLLEITSTGLVPLDRAQASSLADRLHAKLARTNLLCRKGG